MEEWLSITELAERTEIPEPSVRRYITKFHPYFISKGGARAKKYDSTAIDVLKRIKKLYDAGYETAGVSDVIKNEFPVIIDGGEKEELEKNAVTPALATAEDVAEIKKALEEQKAFNELLIQRLAAQERFIKETLENRDQLLLEKLTEQKQEKEVTPAPAPEEVKKGFFNRLFNK